MDIRMLRSLPINGSAMFICKYVRQRSEENFFFTHNKTYAGHLEIVDKLGDRRETLFEASIRSSKGRERNRKLTIIVSPLALEREPVS